MTPGCMLNVLSDPNLDTPGTHLAAGALAPSAAATHGKAHADRVRPYPNSLVRLVWQGPSPLCA